MIVTGRALQQKQFPAGHRPFGILRPTVVRFDLRSERGHAPIVASSKHGCSRSVRSTSASTVPEAVGRMQRLLVGVLPERDRAAVLVDFEVIDGKIARHDRFAQAVVGIDRHRIEPPVTG